MEYLKSKKKSLYYHTTLGGFWTKKMEIVSNTNTNYWIFLQDCTSPLFELRVDNSAGESFTTNSDTLKHTVTLELVKYKGGINHTGLFQLVGNDTTHKVRMSAVQVLHELVQRFLKENKEDV